MNECNLSSMQLRLVMFECMPLHHLTKDVKSTGKNSMNGGSCYFAFPVHWSIRYRLLCAYMAGKDGSHSFALSTCYQQVRKMTAASASSSQASRSKPGPQRRTGEASRLPLSLCRFDLPRGYMVQGEGKSEGEEDNGNFACSGIKEVKVRLLSSGS